MKIITNDGTIYETKNFLLEGNDDSTKLVLYDFDIITRDVPFIKVSVPLKDIVCIVPN